MLTAAYSGLHSPVQGSGVYAALRPKRRCRVASLSDDELLVLLNDSESDRSERKRALTGATAEKVRQAVCAMANDLPNHGKPGVIFIGAEDDGAPANIDITDQLLLTLADMKTDGKILPLPSLFVEKRVLKGAAMAVITVLPADARRFVMTAACGSGPVPGARRLAPRTNACSAKNVATGIGPSTHTQLAAVALTI
jgi:hypothetical protein